MDLENGSPPRFVSFRLIFHFHDYGRKGSHFLTVRTSSKSLYPLRWRHDERVPRFRHSNAPRSARDKSAGWARFEEVRGFPAGGWQPNQVYPGKSSKVALQSQIILKQCTLPWKGEESSFTFQYSKGEIPIFKYLHNYNIQDVVEAQKLQRLPKHHIQLVGGFLKMVGFPNKPMGFSY